MQHNFSKAAQKSIELLKMWLMKTFGTYDGSVVAFNTLLFQLTPRKRKNKLHCIAMIV